MSTVASATTIKPKKGAFHATNVWNELVTGFRSNIELKKYRRNYFTPTYEQCFSSADAIQCMINVLKLHPNFESKQIEKHHAVRLLEKFYESKVFTDANKTERRKAFVTDNGIYQLLSKSDENIFQSVVATNKISEQSVPSTVHQESNSSAMADCLKQYFLLQLEKYLLKKRNPHGGYFLHQIEQEMKAAVTSHVLQHLQNGIPTDPLTIAGQLVDWLPESMSIVIDYPQSLEGRHLPDYPSFIYDLFDMVVDTFDMQRGYLSSSMGIFNLIFQLILHKGNPLSLDSLYDRDDSRPVNCFPSEIYAGRSNHNPYMNLKSRGTHSKGSGRVPRLDAYEYRKFQMPEEEKSFGFSNLRRKSLSSCDLFHVTSKTLTSPFDEIQNWLNNKSPPNNHQEKITSDEFELIQLALLHLTTSNRQYLFVILYFLVQCVKNTQFCPNDKIRSRIQRSFVKLMNIQSEETLASMNIFDCFMDHYEKLFEISTDTKKIVTRRLNKSKKENKPVGLPTSSTSTKKPNDDRQFRQTFKQLRVSRPLTYNEHLDPNAATTFIRKPFVSSPPKESKEKTITASCSTSPRRRARSFEPRAHTTTLFDKTINPFQKLRVILKRND